MGYTTEFQGKFKFSKPLTPAQTAYVNQWGDCRRMKRDANKCKKLADPTREAVGLPLGREGEFFAGGLGFAGQDDDPSVLEHNSPPSTQRVGGVQWRGNEDGQYREWDGSEKFYNYVEWLRYMIVNFFERWSVKLNGVVAFQGEERKDKGVIVVKDSVVGTAKKGKLTDAKEEAPAKPLDRFITDATEAVVNVYDEFRDDLNGESIGERELDSLRELLGDWFRDKLS